MFTYFRNLRKAYRHAYRKGPERLAADSAIEEFKNLRVEHANRFLNELIQKSVDIHNNLATRHATFSFLHTFNSVWKVPEEKLEDVFSFFFEACISTAYTHCCESMYQDDVLLELRMMHYPRLKKRLIGINSRSKLQLDADFQLIGEYIRLLRCIADKRSKREEKLDCAQERGDLMQFIASVLFDSVQISNAMKYHENICAMLGEFLDREADGIIEFQDKCIDKVYASMKEV